MSNRGARGFATVSGFISHLSLPSRRDAFSGHGNCASDLLHDPDEPHDPGNSDRAAGNPDFLSRVSRRLYAPPAHRPNHVAALALRLGYRRDHLSHALPNLSAWVKTETIQEYELLKCAGARRDLVQF